MRHSPLVGRSAELAALVAALDDARAGHGRLVLVEGEPGIGKTRLAEELLAHAAATGARVGIGRAWDGAGAPPWFVWTEALRGLGVAPPRILDGDVDGAGDAARFALLQELADRLRVLAEEAPLAFALDDVQWADVPSLLALRFVARGLAGARVLLVATARVPSEAPPEIAALLEGVRREAEVLPLAGLGAEALGALALDRGVPSPGAGALLREATGGNPLYAHELLLDRDAQAALRRGEPPTVPRSLARVLERHLARLPATDRSLLAVAAIGPRPLRAVELARAAEVDVAFAERALAEAVDASLVVRAGDGFDFAHDLLRRAAAQPLDASERAARHAAWARVLYGDERVADVAHHLLAADPAGSSETAAIAALAAARQARSRLAFEEAAAWIARAGAAHERGGRTAALGRALAQLAEARCDCGDTTAATAAAERALAIGRQLDDAELVAEGALALGRRRMLAQADRPLARVLEEALAGLARVVGDEARLRSLRCALEARLACALQPDAEPDRALGLARAAIATARSAHDRALAARTLRAARPAFRALDDLDERLAIDRELAALAVELDDEVLAAEAHVHLFQMALEAGDATLAAHHGDELERLATRVRLADLALAAASSRVLRAVIASDFDGAARGIAELEATRERWAPRLASALPMDPTLPLRATLAMARGDHDALVELAAAVMRHRIPPHVAQVLSALLLARAGRTGEARARYEAAAAPVLDGPPSLLLWAQLGELCALLCDRRRAERLYQRLSPFAGRHLAWSPFWAYDGAMDRVLGGLAAVAGRLDAAHAHYAQAIAAEESLQAHAFAARTRADRDALVGPTVAARAPSSRTKTRPSRVPSFTRDGDGWRITFGTVSTHAADSDGIGYLALLLARPDVPVSAIELLASRGRGGDGHVPRSGDAGEVLDERAIASYRARARELRTALDEALHDSDEGAAVAARSELAFLEVELGRALGLSGRGRRAASDLERARVNVTMRLRKAIARLREHAPALADHLARSVRTGATCMYQPPVTDGE